MPRIVFVDPQDPLEPFWWLAMIVDPCDHKLFFSIMGEEIPVTDHLVCYFDDGSYSSVAETELMEFRVDGEPFTTWMDDKTFRTSRAVRNVLRYVNEQRVPVKFKWMKHKMSEGVFKKKVWKEKAELKFKNEEAH